MIEVHDLVKTFGDFKAVDGISFAVGEAEIFAFLGPNGAGKTTTIHLLLGILEQGSHDDLIAAGGTYAELFELQARSYR